MKSKVKRFACPAIPVVVLVLAVIVFTWANLSMAASTESDSSTKIRRSPTERTEARIKDLQDALKITPEQQELWKALTQVMKDNAKVLEDVIKDRAGKSKEMNAVEDLKSYSRISEVQVEGMKKFIPAFEALYSSMSDEQKKNADVLFKMGREGRHKRR